MTHPFVAATATVERSRAIAELEEALRVLRDIVDAPYAIRMARQHIDAAAEACGRSMDLESEINDAEEAAQ